MRQLLFSYLKHRKGAAFLFILAFLLILVIIPFSITSLQDSFTMVESDITHYARGSYDLLVRPHGAKHDLEDELGVVPENYLGFGEGGISIEQWQIIKERPDIEIAAPISSLGYFTGIKNNMAYSPPEESTRYITQYYTTDGVNRYAIGEEYACILLASSGEIPKRYQYGPYEHVLNHQDLFNDCTDRSAQFPLPPTYHLLVAIDPVEEQALTGISFEQLLEDHSNWMLREFSDAHVIPVLQLKEGKVSLEMESTIDQLDIGPEETRRYRNQIGLVNYYVPDDVNYLYFGSKFYDDEYHELVDQLMFLPPTNSKVYHFDLSQRVEPFVEYDGILVNEQGKLETLVAESGKYTTSINPSYTSLYYLAGHVKYEQIGKRLKIKKVGEHNGAPTYREIKQVGETTVEAFANRRSVSLIVDPIGEYEIGKRKQQLASSPLGIYHLAPIKYIGENKDQSIEMLPTITPGSFVTPPARGVTNIDSAAVVKGEQPIDAIRVKVAGIDGYTREAAEKITTIADEIEAMGLQVSIIAGASPQTMEVEVEGVGLVAESWTTLGAAGSIIHQWNVTNIILAISFILITITYIFNRMTFWQVHNQHQLTLLYQLGWERKHLLRLSRREIGFLCIMTWLISLGGIYGLQLQLDNISNNVYIWHIIVTLLIILLIFLLINRKIREIFIKQGEEQVENIVMKKQLGETIQRNQSSLVRKNIYFFRKYLRSPFIQILIVSALSSFVYLSLTETVQQTNLTILGQYINLNISNWHLLLMISAYILAVLTLIESITSLLMTREKEIGIFRSIGWKMSHIFKLYMKETAIWAGLSIFIGSIISFLVYAIFYSVNLTTWFVIGASFFGFYFLVLLVTALIIQYYLRKNLGDTLVLRRN